MNELDKKAIFISIDDNIFEIAQLANTLGYLIVNNFIQKRKKPDVNYYIGSGKLKEIENFLEDCKVDLIIVNGELKPSQWFNLEKKLNVQVYDRIRLILSIFEKQAEPKEAKLQVKLAQLQYERPFVRELIHRARSGEHPGLMAGGEYQVDDYYEMIKKQMKKTKENLEKIENSRELQRKTRHESGFYLVSLAGYTNAGKSSLLNLLSGEKVKVEGKLFSTLSTTTRKIPIKTTGKTMPILLTDTVGFIQDLPSWVIDAFHSTLEEIKLADVVLLVVDGSEDAKFVKNKLEVSFSELQEIGPNANIIIAINKIDLIDKKQLDILLDRLNENKSFQDKIHVPISIKNNANIDLLFKKIHESLPNLIKLKIKIPNNNNSQSFLSELYDKTKVICVSFKENIFIEIECNLKIKDLIISKCQELKGSVLETNSM